MTVIEVKGLAIFNLNNEMTLHSQEYDSCPFVWYIWAFYFAKCLRLFRLEFCSEFSYFVVLLLDMSVHKYTIKVYI